MNVCTSVDKQQSTAHALSRLLDSLAPTSALVGGRPPSDRAVRDAEFGRLGGITSVQGKVRCELRAWFPATGQLAAPGAEACQYFPDVLCLLNHLPSLRLRQLSQHDPCESPSSVASGPP